MKSIAVAVAITLIAASSALAASKRTSSNYPKMRDSRAMVIESDPSDVYVRGRLIGRDPDPAIQSRLKSDYYFFFGS
jgi:hypothetical protein